MNLQPLPASLPLAVNKGQLSGFFLNNIDDISCCADKQPERFITGR